MPVSVIMPAFNAARFIEAALRSLVRERSAVDLDVIVVDDGSTDGTRAILEAFGRDHPEVRLFRNPGKGIAAARNTGLDHLPVDCELVTFLDADDVSYPGRIARQQARLEADPTIDVLYGMVEMFTELDEATLAPAAGSPTKRLRGPYLQAAMYRRTAIDRVGRFDETFRQGCDSDFVLRVIEHQCRLVLEHGVAAYYRRHDANVTLNAEERQREFMLASLKWAVRYRLRNKGRLPAIFAELFLQKGAMLEEFGE